MYVRRHGAANGIDAMPASVAFTTAELPAQIEPVKKTHDEDLIAGYAGAFLHPHHPDAIADVGRR